MFFQKHIAFNTKKKRVEGLSRIPISQGSRGSEPAQPKLTFLSLQWIKAYLEVPGLADVGCHTWLESVTLQYRTVQSLICLETPKHILQQIPQMHVQCVFLQNARLWPDYILKQININPMVLETTFEVWKYLAKKTHQNAAQRCSSMGWISTIWLLSG